MGPEWNLHEPPHLERTAPGAPVSQRGAPLSVGEEPPVPTPSAQGVHGLSLVAQPATAISGGLTSEEPATLVAPVSTRFPVAGKPGPTLQCATPSPPGGLRALRVDGRGLLEGNQRKDRPS